jgi:hypothetical protein
VPNFRFHADDKRDPAAKDKLKEAFAAAHLKAKVEVYEPAITAGRRAAARSSQAPLLLLVRVNTGF